ncbi:hypothetical protein AB0G15_09785 [Streptosporangium sp. NPDC023825]|uniref:hypothetical protein n=1 Tax=Streptosporangium sp. NPDC023825 TaxID=3154909 RepID=UPI003438995B
MIDADRLDQQLTRTRGSFGSSILEITSDDTGHLVAVATDARAVVPEGGGFDPVGGAQVVQVFGTGPLQPALVRGQERLTDAGGRLAVAFEQRPYLFDDVRESDTMREAVTFNPSGPELRTTLFVDFLGYLRRGLPGGQATGPDLPR